ncbi:type VI secretion system tip protein VgrG [Salmonella enterica]
MSFVSTGNKTVGSDGPAITTPPIVGENNGVSSGAAVASVTDAAEQMAEQAVELLFGELPEPSGLVKAAVAAAQAAAVAAGISDIAGAAQDVMSSLISGPGVHNVTVSGSAVPPQMLLFASLNGSETLGALFTYVVQLKTPDTLNLGYVSPAANLPLKPMVGKDLCVNIELDGGGKRHISGLVTAARVVGHEGRSVTYELRMEPWVKLLTHTSDYKAFQNKTVVDILDEVLAEYPYPVEKRLVESYPVRTWQVQYGETDFDFLQRLMQEWGIYWWFEHSEDSHTLVLADAISAHKACPDSPLVEWHQEGLKLDKEFIHTITANESLRTGQWVLDDFDFTKPRSLLANTVANPRETGHATYEHYEWPGDYFDKSEGEMLTRIRMEAQRSPGSRVLGGGNIRTLMTGYTFTLMNHPTAELNQEYLLAQTTLFVQDNAQHSGQDQHFTFSTSFELHPTREVYRPQRTISKPHTKGPQSAIVTGPAGQEIWTDQYGRVKVQFGWDRYGKRDENSSCWIRVSYPWAGKGFGMIQITEWVRDEYDHPVCIRQPGGRATQIKRDYAGRILSETDADGRKRKWQRDAFGQITTYRDHRTTAAYRYNSEGNLVHREVNDQKWQYRYTEDGQIKEVIYPDGSREQWAYNAQGSLTAHTDAAGRTTHYAEDRWLRLTGVTDAEGRSTYWQYRPGESNPHEKVSAVISSSSDPVLGCHRSYLNRIRY